MTKFHKSKIPKELNLLYFHKTQAKKITSWAGLLGVFSSNWARGRISAYVGYFFIHILKSWAASPKVSSQVGPLGWISAFSAKVGLFGFFRPQLSFFGRNKVFWYIILFQSETLVLFVHHNILRHLILQVWAYVQLHQKSYLRFCVKAKVSKLVGLKNKVDVDRLT